VQPWYTDRVGDLLIGAGVVVGVTGALFYRSARSDLDAANAASTYPEQVTLYEQAKTSRTYAVVIGAGGVGLITAGLIRYLVHDRRTETRPVTAVTVAPVDGGGVVSWSGGF
jgi:hypothetical protein